MKFPWAFFRRRGLLVGFVALLATASHCSSPTPPERSLSGVAQLLGGAIRGVVKPEELIWEPGHGVLEELLLGRRVLFLGKAHEGSAPLLTDAHATLSSVNTQLERVDGITSSARQVSSNVSVLTSLFTATLGGPLVRAAAFSYGLNKAVKARKAGKDAGAHSLRTGGRGRRRGKK